MNEKGRGKAAPSDESKRAGNAPPFSLAGRDCAESGHNAARCGQPAGQNTTPNSSRPRTWLLSIPAAPKADPGVIPDTET